MIPTSHKTIFILTGKPFDCPTKETDGSPPAELMGAGRDDAGGKLLWHFGHLVAAL